MSSLWKKSEADAALHPLIAEYTVGDDPTNDIVLFPYDIQASAAHVRMLEKIGVLTSEEASCLLGGLDELQSMYDEGNITISIDEEDGHTVIEQYLTEKYGDVGKKIHTGRSRNDQSLVAQRLFMRDQLDAVRVAVLDLATMFIATAKKYEKIPFPGYTHTQQAMLSSIGHYCCSFVESLMDDAEYAIAVQSYINKNPLGSAAGFGVSFPLDREYTKEQMQFDHVQMNSLYCQSSRGKFESAFLEVLTQVMMTLDTFAKDMIMFTAQECGFFAFDDSLVTGSSIMPQKRNLDGLEIVRGNTRVVMSNQATIQNIATGLLSGYHRNYQLIKKPLIESVHIALQSIAVVGLHIQGLTPKPKRIKQCITKEIFMADIANTMVQEQGIPFRDAYKRAAEQLDEYEVDFDANIASKISPGAPGNLQLDLYEKRLHELRTCNE